MLPSFGWLVNLVLGFWKLNPPDKEAVGSTSVVKEGPEVDMGSKLFESVLAMEDIDANALAGAAAFSAVGPGFKNEKVPVDDDAVPEMDDGMPVIDVP